MTIEINEAAPGAALALLTVAEVDVAPGSAQAVILPTRELDGGSAPNSYDAPGTCLSSQAFRITSSSPIAVYQYNPMTNAFSNDASMLLPVESLGTTYRVLGWQAGHPIPQVVEPIGTIVDRSFVTIVGTQSSTTVTVTPSWRIRGNSPIDATPAGGTITVTLNAFDVLNLETDDATIDDDPTLMADLSGTAVVASKPVAVFSGTESAGAPAWLGVPTYPGWSDETGFFDHLEEQLVPSASLGTTYVVPRSPVRSTASFREPDVIRFVGADVSATVTTSLNTPFDSFTLLPGEVKTTWTQDDVIVTANAPIMIGQILVGQGYVEGAAIGDPSLVIMPVLNQYGSRYVVVAPSSWTQTWVVITAEAESDVTVDGAPTDGWAAEPSATVGSTTWETRRGMVDPGVHTITGVQPFGVVLYGYGSGGSYAIVGGAVF